MNLTKHEFIALELLKVFLPQGIHPDIAIVLSCEIAQTFCDRLSRTSLGTSGE